MGKGADKNYGHFKIFEICGHAAQREPARAARPPSRPQPASKKDTSEHVILFTGFTEKLENTKITTEPANMQLMVHKKGMASYFWVVLENEVDKSDFWVIQYVK